MMKIRLISLCLIFALAPVSTLAAKKIDLSADLESAQAALAAGNYQKAFAQYSGFAAKNPLAQFSLALFYQNGWGRPVDETEACRWFEKSARGNIPAGQHFYADCLAKGTDRTANSPEAIKWYKKAADSGHLISLCSAGELYITGKGVSKDMGQGLELITQAARQGVPAAMLRLADLHREGFHVKQDLPVARHWYQQAAEQRSPEAQYQLGVMLGEGRGGETDLDASLFWLETAASEGYAPAYLPTAILYANAKVVPETGALSPEHLAKIYLWISAAKARPSDAAQLADIKKIEEMALAVMPPSWRETLDKRVAEHLEKFKPHHAVGQ